MYLEQISNEKRKYLEILSDEFPEFLEKYIALPLLQRLRDVGYFCGMDYASKQIYQFRYFYSRLDHSIAVALIVWHFTKDKKATLAGLFHDVSTPTFAHVIDLMKGDYLKQEYTESFTEKILRTSSELSLCLQQDQIMFEEILQVSDYSIAEKKRPYLCADRLEGIFSGLYLWTQTKSLEEIRAMYQSLCVLSDSNGVEELGFVSEQRALEFFYWSIENGRGYLRPEDLYEMQLLSQIVRDCIDLGVFSEEEVFASKEEEIYRRIKCCKFAEIEKKIWVFEHVQEVQTSPTVLTDHLCFPVKTKFRYVDPLVDIQTSRVRLSQWKPALQKELESFFQEVSFQYVYASEL